MKSLLLLMIFSSLFSKDFRYQMVFDDFMYDCIESYKEQLILENEYEQKNFCYCIFNDFSNGFSENEYEHLILQHNHYSDVFKESIAIQMMFQLSIYKCLDNV